MKRSSQLTRKKPLQRGTKPLKRSRLKPMSREKRNYMRQYLEMCAKDGKTLYMDRHHPGGRRGILLLCYILIPSWKHQRIHGSERKQAMAEGWLNPAFEGRPFDHSWPRAWTPEMEAHWPEEYRRK